MPCVPFHFEEFHAQLGSETQEETGDGSSHKRRCTLPVEVRRMSTKTKAAPQASRTSSVIRYLVNDAGERQDVVMPVAVFEKLLDRLEDLEDIRDARAAKQEDQWETLEEVRARLGV